MTIRDRCRPLSLSAILPVLLAGCSGMPGGGDERLATAPPVVQQVPQSYVIQIAPNYQAAELEAEQRRQALAALEAQARAETVYAPFDPGSGIAEAEARASAAEARAETLAAQLAEARAAVAEAEAAAKAEAAAADLAARSSETLSQRTVRERVERLADERRRVDRANPDLPDRPVLGQFATRPADAPLVRTAAPAPAPRPAAPPAPVVARAPIPGLKPYILARTALPTAKPRRAPPERTFEVRQASVLNAPTGATRAEPRIAPEATGDLSTRFFPTPGKPSTLGTDRDAPLDLATIDAVPYGIGAAVAPEGDDMPWAEAVRLIEAGEVEALSIDGDADLVLTLCGGRSILTTPPDLAAAATLTAPQIICGQNKPLALR